MFKKLYNVETIITPKNGGRYSVTKREKLTRKQAAKLVNMRKCGIGDSTKGYKWIAYAVELV